MQQDLRLIHLRLKDSDEDWPYGPLQSLSNSPLSGFILEPTRTVLKSTSFLNKKNILKKRSRSELMRQKLTSGSPVHRRAGGMRRQHDGALADRTQDSLILDRTVTDSVISAIRSDSPSSRAVDCFSSRTSSCQTLDQSERKLLRFDERVEQFRAMNLEDAQRLWAAESDDDSSDEGLMMTFPLKRPPFSQNNKERNFSTESKLMAKLPPTTLKSPSASPQKKLSSVIYLDWSDLGWMDLEQIWMEWIAGVLNLEWIGSDWFGAPGAPVVLPY